MEGGCMNEMHEQFERGESAEQSNHETIESWEEYQMDGLHITQNEMTGWLNTWGTPNETECPPYHK